MRSMKGKHVVRSTAALLLLVSGCAADQGTGLLALSISADGSIPPAAASSVALSVPGTKSRTWTGTFPRADRQPLLLEYPNLPASDSPVTITVEAWDSASCLVGSASKQVSIKAGVTTASDIVLAKPAVTCGDGGAPPSTDAQPAEAGSPIDGSDMALDGPGTGGAEAGVPNVDLAVALDSSMTDGPSDVPQSPFVDAGAGPETGDSTPVEATDARPGSEVPRDVPLGTGGVSGLGGITSSGAGGVIGSGGVSGQGGITSSGTGGVIGSGGLSGLGGITSSGTGGVIGSGGLASSGGTTGAGSGGIYGSGGVGTGGAAETGGTPGAGGSPGTGGTPGTHTETATATVTSTSTSTGTATSTAEHTSTASHTATRTSTATAVGTGTDDWTGLAAYYKLEAPIDGIYYPDSTTNGLTATANGVTTAPGAPVPGGSSYSAHIDAHISPPAYPVIRTPYVTPSSYKTGLSLSAWVRPIDLAYNVAGDPGPAIYSNTLDIEFKWSDGVTTIICFNGDGIPPTATIAGDVNQYHQWHYVVCSWDGSNWTMYVNGELRATTGWAYLNEADSLFLGFYWFSADIDEVRAYNRGLRDDEVKNLYDCNMTDCSSTHPTTATTTTTNTSTTTVTETQTVTGTVTNTNTGTATATETVTVADASMAYSSMSSEAACP
jgi:hypothetical protein